MLTKRRNKAISIRVVTDQSLLFDLDRIDGTDLLRSRVDGNEMFKDCLFVRHSDRKPVEIQIDLTRFGVHHSTNKLVQVFDLEWNKHCVELLRGERRVVYIRRERFRNGVADNAVDFCVAIEILNAVGYGQVFCRDLSRGSFVAFIERAISEK